MNIFYIKILGNNLSNIIPFFVIVLVLQIFNNSFSRENSPVTINMKHQMEEQAQAVLWENLLLHEPGWYNSKEALLIAENSIIYQRASGGWPKNIDLSQPLTDSEKKKLLKYPNKPFSTIDNGATYTELRFLGQVIKNSRKKDHIKAFLKGFDYLLKAQYANGGWPQFYPLRKGYYSHITFNDDAMIGVMRLIRDVIKNESDYNFIDEGRRDRARTALERGTNCILETQLKVNNELTAWCAQYDEKTLQPAKARSYELVSLSGEETVSIIQFLMEIEDPSPRVIQAVQSAVSWLDKVKIEGIRVIKNPDSGSPTGYNKIVISDPKAPPIWARFYIIDSNKPFFSDRDGKIYYDLSEISSERRNNYGWLGYWPEEIINYYYPKWQKKWARGHNVLKQK